MLINDHFKNYKSYGIQNLNAQIIVLAACC